MSSKIRTRMGDGELVTMSPSEIREDIAVGTRDAAGKAGIPELTHEEQERLYEIIADPSRIVSVAPGDEVVVTDDGVPGSFYCGQDDSGAGIPLSRGQATLTYERVCAADTVSLGHSDYSFKPVKNVISDETSEYYNISMGTTAPFIYGAQPNLGSYYQPDGPVRNPADLLLGGDVKAAQEAQEEAAEKMRQDILYCGRKLNDVGCEGLNLDTSASGGDADFMGTLQVVSELKEEAPGMPVIVGASGEFVLGMHGEVTFNDKQLAGMYPHDQVKVAEEAHLRSGDRHQHERVLGVERGPVRDLHQGGRVSRQHTGPCECGHGRRRHTHVRGAAGRCTDEGHQIPGRARQGGRVVGRRG
jgi:dimethylamine--corrinoid protein Co-methyltransferase